MSALLSGSRSAQTIEIEHRLQAGESLSSIARTMGVSRQRIQFLKRRLFTTPSLQPPQPSQTRDWVKAVEGPQVTKRERTPVWVNNSKQLMLRCIPPTHMRRFKVAQMFWVDGMSMLDIAVALDITEKSVELILARLRKKA